MFDISASPAFSPESVRRQKWCLSKRRLAAALITTRAVKTVTPSCAWLESFIAPPPSRNLDIVAWVRAIAVTDFRS
ncbi:MAG TPA: hypothetical protein V6D16_12690 [Candidatus Obscuribacterales bacterium]